MPSRDDAAEEHATTPSVAAAAQRPHPAPCLERRAIDRPSPVTTRSHAARAVEADGRARAPRRRRSSAPSAAKPAPSRRLRRRRAGRGTGRARRASEPTLELVDCAGRAPFCGPKTRAAPRSPSSGLRRRTATRRARLAAQLADDLAHAGAAVDGRRAADADEQLARLPRRAPRASARRARATTRERIAARGARASPIASAESTTAVPSGSTSQRARRGPAERVARPSRTPLAAARGLQTAEVPSPPSATGNSSASTPRAADPTASCAAAAAGVRTPLRLAGDASASTLAAPPASRPRAVLVAVVACLAASRTRGPRARGRSGRCRSRPTPRSPGGRSRTRSPCAYAMP